MSVMLSYFISTVIGALLGWITNVLAVRMLFRPRRPFNLLGLTIQGLVPRTQSQIARRVSKAITGKLLAGEDLHKILREVELISHLRKVTDSIIQREFSQLPLSRFRLSGMVLDKVIPIIQNRVADSLPKTLDDIDQAVVGEFLKEIDLETHICQKMESLDLDELEGLINSISRRELRMIELLGAVIGAVVGCLEGLFFQFV